ncbi:MAG: hypothetical protein JXR64_06585 [Spirochaetales bacterium]|nr:hypothetical protein [Spirochaetales bacterium]
MVDKSEKKAIFNSIPKEGFIKVPITGNVNVNSKEKVLLVRKANELMNQKNYEQAKRIYLAIDYSAGLIRLGDIYESKGEILEAIKMYKAAGAKAKMTAISEKMAGIIKLWLKVK